MHYYANRDAITARNRRKRAEVRAEMIAAYGGVCRCCKEANPRFLTLDHKKGGGLAHYREVGGTLQVMLDLRAKGWPRRLFQLLCYNCNMGRAHNTRNPGVCPHKDATA